MPPDLATKHDDQKVGGQQRSSDQYQQTTQAGHSMTDGVFLDFLYPQQALALLHRRSAQQWRRWEKRNARRLPEGFVVASRGYASTRTAKAKRTAKQQRAKGLNEQTADDFVFPEEPVEQRGQKAAGGDAAWWHHPTGAVNEADSSHEEANAADFADSPMDLAEPASDAIRKLRNIMSFNRKRQDVRKRPHEAVEQAWRLYQAIDDADEEDVRLKIEFLSWLSTQQTDESDKHCAELYHSLPADQRTLQVYEDALALFLRRNQQLSASKLHREALRNLENGHQISRTLFRYAIDNDLWRLAIRTEGRHKEIYGDSGQMQLFWLHATEIPQLLSKARKLAKSLRPVAKTGRIDSHTQQFCMRFFREAITQEFLQEDQTLRSIRATSKQQPPRDQIRRLFSMLALWDSDNSKIFEATLMSILDPNARISYPKMHGLVTSVYNMYKGKLGVRPSENLLMTLLKRVTRYAGALRNDERVPRSLSVASVVRDWRHFHSRLSKEAHAERIAYYARTGRLAQHETAMEDLRNEYPNPQVRKGMLWSSIYLHARRIDLDCAQQAFAAVKRELAELGEEPDLKCWNTLLHAHFKADDLEGGLTNLKNLIDYAKLTPDAHSFHPLTEMFAKRGDVDGVENMLEQYDELTRAPRVTPLLGSLITAFVRAEDVATAEKVLEDTVQRVKAGEIQGSLTKCFNILLTALAVGRDLDATKRVYRKMREEKVRLDADTYAALIFALTVRRQTDAAYKIITSAMKEKQIEPTAFHFGLIMAGYNTAGRADDALRVHDDMTRLNVKPTSRSQTAYLHAHAIAENRSASRHRSYPSSQEEPLEPTIRELKRIAQLPDEHGNVATTSGVGLRYGGISIEDLAAHFDFLVFVHGKRRCLEAVQQLYAQYKGLAAERGFEQEAPPIRLLTALMSAYWRAGDYKAVEASWKLAKVRADAISPAIPVSLLSKSEQQLAAPLGQHMPDVLELEPVAQDAIDKAPEESAESDSQTTMTAASSANSSQAQAQAQPSPSRSLLRPAPARRHILTRPLRYYLAALTAQNRFSDAISTVTSLLTQGYVLDNRTFNYFIECLCRASPPLALLAFTLTERFLIPHFPGWTTHGFAANRPQARAEGLQNLRARYLKPGQLMPQYRLLVRLGSVLLDVRRLEAMGRRRSRTWREAELDRYVGTIAQIRERAPRTMFVVQTMPKRPDVLQSRLLGQDR